LHSACRIFSSSGIRAGHPLGFSYLPALHVHRHASSESALSSAWEQPNAPTVKDQSDAEIRDTIKLRQTRPFEALDQGYLTGPPPFFAFFAPGIQDFAGG
jgi:hypothetical protein